MSAELNELHFAAGEELAAHVAGEISDRLRLAIAARGSASLVVSGGKSPIAMFHHLSRSVLDWDKVIITLADERWVPPDDAESNEGLVRKHLLAAEAARARFVPMKVPVARPEDATKIVCESLSSIPMPFDVVLLGMGADGHTASWFPDAPRIADCLADPGICFPIESPVAGLPRMTLTPAAILNSRFILLAFSGLKKREVFEHARISGDPTKLPVRVVLHQTCVPVAVRYSEREMRSPPHEACA